VWRRAGGGKKKGFVCIPRCLGICQRLKPESAEKAVLISTTWRHSAMSKIAEIFLGSASPQSFPKTTSTTSPLKSRTSPLKTWRPAPLIAHTATTYPFPLNRPWPPGTHPPALPTFDASKRGLEAIEGERFGSEGREKLVLVIQAVWYSHAMLSKAGVKAFIAVLRPARKDPWALWPRRCMRVLVRIFSFSWCVTTFH